MPFKIDDQFRVLDVRVEDPALKAKIDGLLEAARTPEEERGVFNMLRAAAYADGNKFILNDDEAARLLKGSKEFDRAFSRGKRQNKVYNQVAAFKKYPDYSVPVMARFAGLTDAKVFFKIIHEDGTEFPVIKGVVDSFGNSRVEFFPPKMGQYKIYASTDKNNFLSDSTAVGELSVIEDSPVVAIDIAGLFNTYGHDRAVDFLKKVQSSGYQIVGVTPHDDITAQAQISALISDDGLKNIPIVHNSFTLSEYFETDVGKQEFLAEYVKHLAGIRGVPVVAGVGFTNIDKKGLELTGLFGEDDILIADRTLSLALRHLQDQNNIGRYNKKVNEFVAGRDNDDQKTRMSWALTTALGTKYTDGNSFEYVLDNSPARDHNRAAFYAFLDNIAKVDVNDPIYLETYAWFSSEDGMAIALLLAEKAERARGNENRPPWGGFAKRLRTLIEQVDKDRSNPRLEERAKLEAEINTALENAKIPDRSDPNIPIYMLLDKTAKFQLALPDGVHDGWRSLDIMRSAGINLNIVPVDYGYVDKNGVVDETYYRRDPVGKVIPCKHTKFAAMLITKDDGSKEWIAIGGGRHPSSKMFGPSSFRKAEEPNLVRKIFGQSMSNFDDDTYIMRGPIVREIVDEITSDIEDNFGHVIPAPAFAGVNSGGDDENQTPSLESKAGDNRMWLAIRWPWGGVPTAASLWDLMWNNSPGAEELTIVNSFAMNSKWEDELKHLILNESAGYATKIQKKLNIVLGGMSFIGDVFDKYKAATLSQMILWARSTGQDINIYIVKSTDDEDLVKASNQQLHNKIYFLSNKNPENDIAITGNLNLDAMSFKDKEDALVMMGPGTQDVKARIAELKAKSVHMNTVPGVVFPRADGSYMNKEELEKFILQQFTTSKTGSDPEAPTAMGFPRAFGRMFVTAANAIIPKVLPQPKAYGVDTTYTPTVVTGGGVKEYQRVDTNVDVALYFGMRTYIRLLMGAAGIFGKTKFGGVNVAASVDSIISKPREEYDAFTARGLGIDTQTSLLISEGGKDIAGSFSIGMTPVSLEFRPRWSRFAAIIRPMKIGFLTNFADSAGLPGASLYIGSSLEFLWRDLPPVRDGDFTHPFE